MGEPPRFRPRIFAPAQDRTPRFLRFRATTCYGAEQGEYSPCSVFIWHMSNCPQAYEAPWITQSLEELRPGESPC
jgi:hypothetical protein